MPTETPIMDVETRKAIARKLFEDLQDQMVYLSGRWADEHEYEDLKDYAEPLRPMIKAVGGSIVKMTSRPFGVIYTLGGVAYIITMKANGDYEYKRRA